MNEKKDLEMIRGLLEKDKVDPVLPYGVAAYKGEVLLYFKQPVETIRMSPADARAMSLMLRQRANEIERTPGL